MDEAQRVQTHKAAQTGKHFQQYGPHLLHKLVHVLSHTPVVNLHGKSNDQSNHECRVQGQLLGMREHGPERVKAVNKPS